MLRKELIQIVIVLHLRKGLGQGWDQSGAVHGGAGLDIHVVFVFVFRPFCQASGPCVSPPQLIVPRILAVYAWRLSRMAAHSRISRSKDQAALAGLVEGRRTAARPVRGSWYFL